MKLFANGCSFTWGGAVYPTLHDEYGIQLDWWNTSNTNLQRIKQVWPGQLADSLQIDHVNLSMGCGSNDRIVRTTLDYFVDQISGGTFEPDWLAVIQWSQAPRFEFWDDISESWALCLPTGSMTDKHTDYKHKQHIDKLKDLYYSYANDKTYSQKYFQQVVNLSCFFDKHHIQYYFSNLDKQVLNHLDSWQQDYLRNHISWLESDPRFYFGDLFDDYHESGSGHPSLIGHRQIAQNIYNYIKDKI